MRATHAEKVVEELFMNSALRKAIKLVYIISYKKEDM